jgi:hypothetical protein
MKYKIEKRIPIPPRHLKTNDVRWTASKMVPGDSVGGVTKAVASNFWYHLNKRGLKCIFRTEAGKKTVRVWAEA